MKNMIKDGWHTIAGYEVYVENGEVIRGVSSSDWRQTTTYPYRASRTGGWDSTGPISVAAFRAGVCRSTVAMF